MKLTLLQQIALSLRHRPLVLPLLLATVCIDVLLVGTDTSLRIEEFVLWGILLPQAGLLAFWTSHGAQWWSLRLVVAGAMISAVCFVCGDNQVDVLLSIFAVYFATLVLIGLVIQFIAWKRDARNTPVDAGAPRFTTWSLLVLMTLLAPVAAVLPSFVWEVDLSEMPIFLAMILMPVVAKVAVAHFHRGVIFAWITVVILGGLIDVLTFQRYDELFGVFLSQGAISCLWFWAVKVPADAQRRMAARRKRREAML